MIDLIDLKENLDIYKKGLSAKGCDIDLDNLLKKNISKNALQVELDELKGQRNTLSKEIGCEILLSISFGQIWIKLFTSISQLRKIS